MVASRNSCRSRSAHPGDLDACRPAFLCLDFMCFRNPIKSHPLLKKCQNRTVQSSVEPDVVECVVRSSTGVDRYDHETGPCQKQTASAAADGGLRDDRRSPSADRSPGAPRTRTTKKTDR